MLFEVKKDCSTACLAWPHRTAILHHDTGMILMDLISTVSAVMQLLWKSWDINSPSSYRRHYRTLDRQLASWCASCDCSCRTDGCAVDWMQWTMKLLHTVWFIELCSAAMLNIMRGPQVWVSWRHRVNQPCSTGGWIDWYLLFLLFGFTDRSKHFYTASHIHPSNHLCGLLFGNISGIFPLAFNYPVSVPSHTH